MSLLYLVLENMVASTLFTHQFLLTFALIRSREDVGLCKFPWNKLTTCLVQNYYDMSVVLAVCGLVLY